MAAAKRNPLVTQLRRMASAPKSSPIVGNAMLIDVPMNGVKKDAMDATKSAAIFTSLSTLKELSVGFIHSPYYNDHNKQSN